MLDINKFIREEGKNSQEEKRFDRAWKRCGRGESREEKEHEPEEREKTKELFRPRGLAPPEMAEHSVNILHFKTNHSQLDKKRKTHTGAHTLRHAHVHAPCCGRCFPPLSTFNKCVGTVWDTWQLWCDVFTDTNLLLTSLDVLLMFTLPPLQVAELQCWGKVLRHPSFNCILNCTFRRCCY